MTVLAHDMGCYALFILTCCNITNYQRPRNALWVDETGGSLIARDYGSEGWEFESSRARHSFQRLMDIPAVAAFWLATE